MQEVQIKGITDGTLTLCLSGEIHSVNAEEFYTTVCAAYDQAPCDVVFDCKELNFLDSTALGTFVKIFRAVYVEVGKRANSARRQTDCSEIFSFACERQRNRKGIHIKQSPLSYPTSKSKTAF